MSFVRAVSKLLLPAFEKDLTSSLQRQMNMLAKLCEPAKLLTAAFRRRSTVVEQIQKRPRCLITEEPHLPGRLGLCLALTRVPVTSSYCNPSRFAATKF